MIARITKGTSHTPYIMQDVKVGGGQNGAMVNDPEVQALYNSIAADYFDRAKVVELFRQPTATRSNYVTYFHEQAFYIPLPAPWRYQVWQPWLKNYGGATSQTLWGGRSYIANVWIDQELKKAMGY